MTRFYESDEGDAIIRDELTHNVADLYNVAYDTMLLMLLRFFTHTDETEQELEVLSDRTPERRVDYVGNEITIHDNRGTCCHSGHCSDTLPSVFRHNDEPWTAPNGAIAQEIVDIVPACPSGALAFTHAGIVGGDTTRERGIYVSKDGPYHVTGSISLLHDAQNERASKEHFALCRCGQSKNKPFCDGSHWYVKFVDDDKQEL